ncbi:MAG: hypothetical protein LBH44_05400 [Treponema sp.]|jgi:hypothetical protein|nr:hypothetical protein [Treponema sp.]
MVVSFIKRHSDQIFISLFLCFLFCGVIPCYSQSEDNIRDSSNIDSLPVGLYIEAIIPPFIMQLNNNAPRLFAGGATYMDIGLGVTFFNNHIKLQANYGFLTQALHESMGGVGPLRYGGHVLGLKMLAGFILEFSSLLGSNLDWLATSFCIGANFSLFDIANEGYTHSGEPGWVSALIMQMEFPRVTISEQKLLRTFSLFTEGQLWFDPTHADVSTVIIPHVIMGVRMYIF